MLHVVVCYYLLLTLLQENVSFEFLKVRHWLRTVRETKKIEKKYECTMYTE